MDVQKHGFDGFYGIGVYWELKPGQTLNLNPAIRTAFLRTRNPSGRTRPTERAGEDVTSMKRDRNLSVGRFAAKDSCSRGVYRKVCSTDTVSPARSQRPRPLRLADMFRTRSTTLPRHDATNGLPQDQSCLCRQH